MTEGAQPHSWKRWMVPLLLLSLAFNLLVLGIIAGAAFNFRDEGRPGPARAFIGEPFIRALETDDRRAFVRRIVGERERLRGNRTELRARIGALLEAISSDSFNSEQVAALLSEQRALASERQDFGEAILLDRLEQMTVEERRAYAQRLREALRLRRNTD